MPAGTRVRANNAFGTITDNPLTAGAVTFNSAQLIYLPAISAIEHAVITLDPLRQFGDPEIVVVTSHTAAGTVATVSRGQYGTIARSHPQGTVWAHAAVDEDFIEILTSITRPSDPYRGQLIFETDTNKYVARSTTDAWIDGLPLGAWPIYVPTVLQNVVVAKTITSANYTRHGRTVIGTVDLLITGAGTAANTVAVSPPVPAARTDVACGSGWIYDSSANIVYGGVAEIMTGGNIVIRRNDAGVGANFLGNGQFTAGLASNDIIRIQFTYEAAT